MAGLVKSNQAVKCVFTAANPTTGAAVNADSLPTGLLYVNGVVNAAVVTIANVTTGVYTASLTLPTLAGGDGVDIRISATVSTIAGEAVVWSSSADTKRVSDLNDSAYAGGAVASVTGAVGSVTGNVGGNVTGSVGSVVGAVGSVTGAVGSVTGAVGSVTGNVGGSVASVSGAVGSVTADVGITQAGADKVWSTTVRKLSAEGVQGIWDALLTNLITVGSIGKRLVDFMTNKVYADPPAAPDNTDIIAIKAKTDNLPADPASNTQVNTRMPSGNVTVGGYTAGTAPPLATDYTAARAGKLDNLDINVGSRGTGDATTANQTVINSNVLARATPADVLAQTQAGLTAQGYTTVRGPYLDELAVANLPGDVDALTASAAAIKFQTDNLPADPASNTQVNTRMATFTYTTPPSTASIVTAILDGLLTGHNIADSVAVALAAAGSAGSDPLLTPLPNDNTYPVGTAGYRIGHNLDAPVSTRAVSGSTTTTSPVTASGDVINIVRGDDYGPAPAGLPRILQTFSAGVIPDATDGGLQYVAPLLAGSPFTGVLIVTGATGEQVFALDLTHTATLAMVAGNYPYAAELTVAGGERTTIRRGTIRVLNPA